MKRQRWTYLALATFALLPLLVLAAYLTADYGNNTRTYWAAFGDTSFLRDEDDLIDPWGAPCRYSVVKRPDGKQEVYIWAEWQDGGKLRLAGAKLTINGEVQVFRNDR